MATIAGLLVELARDPELLERFRNEPEAVMSDYALTEGQQAIILEGDLAKIREAIDYEYAADAAGADDLPRFGEPGAVAMIVTWRPTWRPTWIKPPPESN